MAKKVLAYHDVLLYESDVALLTRRDAWLNDTVLHFYLQYLTHTCASSDVLLMDPSVVSCLVHQCDDEDEYVELAQGVGDLATRRLCVLPVADNATLDCGSSHWSVLLYSDGRFRHVDSRAGHNRSAAHRVAVAFERLLEAVGRTDGHGASVCVEEVADAPQQPNGYDCGMYVLLVAEYCCKQYNEMMAKTRTTAGTTTGMSFGGYVTPERAAKRRVELVQLIEKLQRLETS